MFVLVELAINSGWILSESGRQPWLLSGLLKREYSGVKFINLSLLGMILNTVLLVAGAILSVRYLKEHHTALQTSANY